MIWIGRGKGREEVGDSGERGLENISMGKGNEYRIEEFEFVLILDLFFEMVMVGAGVEGVVDE